MMEIIKTIFRIITNPFVFIYNLAEKIEDEHLETTLGYLVSMGIFLFWGINDLIKCGLSFGFLIKGMFVFCVSSLALWVIENAWKVIYILVVTVTYVPRKINDLCESCTSYNKRYYRVNRTHFWSRSNRTSRYNLNYFIKKDKKKPYKGMRYKNA